MMNLFRSTQQKKVFKLLESHGFNSQDFKEFKIGDLAKQVTTRDFLSPLQQIIREHKMTHLKLLKTSLLTLHIIQISEKVEQNPFLGEIIRQLQIRTRTALRFSSKTANKSYVINEKKEHPEDEGGHHTTKQFYDSSCVQSPENVELNSVSYLLGKLVLPLLHIQEKILYCHELIYRPKVEMNSETCWATINLLKKFSELSQSIQQIGRYYKQLLIPIVCTIRVLSLDIRILYRRVTNYLKKQCAELQLTIESKNSSVIQIFQEEKMKEVIMLVQQLQKINQNVRLLYCNKYFSDMLVLNNIFMPSIFSTGQENLELLYSFLEYRTKMPNSFTISGLLHPPILRTNNSLEMVQNV